MTMNSKRKTLSTLALLACFALPASAQFGGLLGGSKATPASSGDLDTEVRGFLDKSEGVESTASRASLAIVSAFAAEEERAKLKAQFDELAKTTDPKEKGAKFQAISESAGAQIKKLAASDDLGERTNKLSDEKKKLLAQGVANYLLAGIQAKDISPSGQNVMKLASSNPMNFGKVAAVKDALPRLANAVSLAGSSVPQLIKALKGANVQVADVSSSSKEVSITGI
jgi:hypothetical protein